MLTVQVLPRSGVVLRATLSTLEIVTVLVAAHTWAGGELPGVGWVMTVAALVFAAGTAVLRGRVRLRVMVPVLVGAQLLLHCWLVVLAPSSPMSHAHGPHLDLTWQMVLAHVIGGLATALVWELRRRAVEILLSWAASGLLPVPPLRRRPLARWAPARPLRRPLVVVPLRGPPVGLGLVP